MEKKDTGEETNKDEEQPKELTEEEKEKQTQEKLQKRNMERAKANGKKEYVWKNTMEDGYIPFEHVSSNF